jgi:hypothetical protein
MATRGDFSFISDSSQRIMLEDMYAAVEKADAWEDLRADPGPGGFMYGAHDLVTRIDRKLIDRIGHSGATFGITLRSIQYIAIHGWEAFVATFK